MKSLRSAAGAPSPGLRTDLRAELPERLVNGRELLVQRLLRLAGEVVVDGDDPPPQIAAPLPGLVMQRDDPLGQLFGDGIVQGDEPAARPAADPRPLLQQLPRSGQA